MAKFIIIIVMFFPNFDDYLGGNTFIVSHKHDKELEFETQIECFEFITENISDLVLFPSHDQSPSSLSSFSIFSNSLDSSLVTQRNSLTSAPSM